MDTDENGKQAVSEALRNRIVRAGIFSNSTHSCLIDVSYTINFDPQIVSMILENMEGPDLRTLSLVNKLWNVEARQEMRRRGNFVANLIFSKGSSCQGVKAFGLAIEKMNVVPFSGMKISLDELSHGGACGNGTSIPTEILGRISWRHFAIGCNRDSWPPKNCPAVLLVKSVFQHAGTLLQELTIRIPQITKQDEFIHELLQDRSFPQLTTLKYAEVPTAYEENLKYLMAFVSRAPNLQELHSGLPIHLVERQLNGRSVVYMCGSFVGANFGGISQNNINNVRLRKMDLRYAGPGFDFERFNRMFPELLETCCTTTLCQLSMDVIFLVSFMFCGNRLRNLRTLAIRVDYQKLYQLHQHQAILRILTNFDFARIFPNLDKVHIHGFASSQLTPEHLNTFVQQADALGQEPLPDGAVNIKKLFINIPSLDSYTNDSVLRFLGQMFPNIEQLELKGEPGSETPAVFGSIWKYLLHLEKLDVGRENLEDFANLESVFCGIFPQEAAQLREKDEEYLESVNIVPVMPSITCLRNLKTLRLDYPSFHVGPKTDDPSFIFSKVARLIAFSRLPDLTVIVRIYKSLFSWNRTNSTRTKPWTRDVFPPEQVPISSLQ